MNNLEMETLETNTNKSNRPPIVTLVVDLGTDAIKALYCQGRRGEPKYLIENPLIRLVDSPSRNVPYVKLPECHKYCLIGNNFSVFSNKMSPSVKQEKSEYLVYRILAVVGKIAEKLSLPSNFRVRLRPFLPLSEIHNAKFLKSQLTEALKTFEYSGQTYRVECKYRNFSVEGEGVYSYYTHRNPSYYIDDNPTVACIMFGYRNVSMLLFDRGLLDYNNSHSTDLGFYKYLDIVARSGSGAYREEIESAIVTTLTDSASGLTESAPGGFKSEILVESLIRGTREKYRDRRRESIENAIATADKKYWFQIEDWLTKHLPSLDKLDQVIYCGGAVPFFQPQLEEFFSGWNGTLIDTNEMAKTMMDKLRIPVPNQKRFINQSLPLRFADAWGEFVPWVKVKI